MNNVREIRDSVLNLRSLLNLSQLNSDKVFHFPMLGEEVHLYLPYAGFDFIQQEILSKADFFEGELLRHVRNTYFSGSPCKVLDIGGNIGNHAVFFAKFCNATVATFEPQPAIFKILKKNIDLNAPEIIAHNIALGESQGHARIDDYNSKNTGGTGLSLSSTGGFEVISLDSFNYTDIHFIKMDVEGFETNVLKGAKETILRSKPIIWIEIFPDNYQTVSSILFDLGYTIKEQLASADYIFVPKQ